MFGKPSINLSLKGQASSLVDRQVMAVTFEGCKGNASILSKYEHDVILLYC
jgi:hypothetical protein